MTTEARPPRLSKHEYFLSMAKLAATQSTCPRRAVGTVIVDANYHIIGTGYNGVASGQVHCIDVPCPGAEDKSGDNSRCEALHAEQNALLHCLDISRSKIMYSTVSPCFNCCKMILSTPITLIVVAEVYEGDTRGIRMLSNTGREVWLMLSGGNLAIVTR